MFIYELSKQDVDLSKAEALLLGKTANAELADNYLFIDKEIEYMRLAYTKKVYKVLFSSNSSEIKENLAEFDFNKIYDGSFSLKSINNQDYEEKELADVIYQKIKHAKVDLKDAKTKIVIIFLENKAHVCILLWENKQDFNARKAHKRPELHPSSLDPRLARAMVNMASSDEILDPFCGSGGILLEAGLIGLKVVGYDIDRIMLNKARINLEHFGIKDFVLEQKDSTKIKGIFKAVVTDPPYSKNTKDVELEDLYLDFLKNVKCKRIVISFPDSINYKEIIRKTKWRIIEKFEFYLHKSLSKHILVLQ